MKRSIVVVFLIAIVAAVGFASGEAEGDAGEFPTETIEIIAPASAGGGTDQTARNLARLAEDDLGVNIIVNNIPGGGNAIGITAGYQAAPNGYRLVLGQVETVLLPLFDRVDWQASEFVPIMGVNAASSALTVSADSPYETVEDFVEAAKDNPGDLAIGGSSPGTIWHLAAVGFAQAADIDVNVVPYSGGAAPAIQDLLGGNLDAVTVGAGEVTDQVEAGELRVLAVMRDERFSLLPDVPTMTELGYDASFATWWALMAPPGTPADRQEVLHQAFKNAYDSEEFQNFLQQQRFEPNYVAPEDFDEFLESEIAKFEPVIEQLDL